MNRCVLTFTDLYYPAVNGVTDTISLWRDRWSRRYGEMPVVYPSTPGYTPRSGEYPIRSIPAPLYTQYRLGLPLLPSAVPDPDVVHVHTPFTIGIVGLEAARQYGVPLVGSYHTLLSQRVRYSVPSDEIGAGLERLVKQYERWFFDALDLVVTPSDVTQSYLREEVGLGTPVEVVSNGIDTDRFRPVSTAGFRDSYDIPDTGPLVGYTGRHSPEKHLFDLVEAAADTEWKLLFGGDGPVRDFLEERAADRAVDARFLGFLPPADLPAFFSSLDVFAFPSPTETQGLVALQANACGTPVVGADAGALTETVVNGVTGYRYPLGDIDAFGAAVDRALADQSRLRDRCLARRDGMSVDRSLERLGELYDRVEATT